MSAISLDKVILPNRILLEGQERPCYQRAIDCIKSVWRQYQYSKFYDKYRDECEFAHQLAPREWKKESRGLCTFLHGLRSHPVAWHPQVSCLTREKEIDLFAPCIDGLHSLDETALPILMILVDYAKKHPGKAICILGISNGSRLAMWLEVRLRNLAPDTPVKVSTISGVHFGSSRMQLLKQIGMAKRFYPPVLMDELAFGSERAKQLLSEVLAPTDVPRDYEFYGSPNDLLVPDLGSSLPKLGRGERIHILPGHSHDSIVAAVAKQQMDSCIQWIEIHRKSKRQ